MMSLWKSYIRNTRSKETEYFSTFCSLKILMFLFYNLSNSKRGQDINFWGSSQVLWVFPHNVTNNDKSLRKSLISIRLQKRRPFAAHCKKDMLEWPYVYRVDVSKSFLSSRKKIKQKTKQIVKLTMCWSFCIIWRSCTHPWKRLKMR